MPSYKISIGLKGDTIEHEKEIKASNLSEAYDQAHDWAVEEYCIAQAVPLDKEGELAEEMDELTRSIRSIVLTMTRRGHGPVCAHHFLNQMRDHISDAIEEAKDLATPGPENQGSATTAQD